MPHWAADIYAHHLPPDLGTRAGGNTSPNSKASRRRRPAAKNFAMPPPRRTSTFKFQLHDYIARKILHQPPQSCNYADNKEVGAWLNNIVKKGGTEDWRKVLKEATGEDISTRAMNGLLQAANELAGRTKQTPSDRLGVGRSRCPQRDVISAFDSEAIGSTLPGLSLFQPLSPA